MKYFNTILFSAVALASPVVVPRQVAGSGIWNITNFAASSSYSSSMFYRLSVQDELFSGADCSTSNSIVSGECDGASVPGPFAETKCSNPYWGWSLIQAVDNTGAPAHGLNLKIVQYGGSPPSTTVQSSTCIFIPYNITCVPEPESGYPFEQGVIWNVESNFTLHAYPGDAECVYS